MLCHTGHKWHRKSCCRGYHDDAERTGQEQYEAFTGESLLERVKAVDKPFPHNKVKVSALPLQKTRAKVSNSSPTSRMTMKSLHACALAVSRGMETIIFSREPGVSSCTICWWRFLHKLERSLWRQDKYSCYYLQGVWWRSHHRMLKPDELKTSED